MEERLTWKEIVEKYPKQWVGLKDVKFVDDDGVNVESAIVVYSGLPKFEMTKIALTQDEIFIDHTDMDNSGLSLGILEINLSS